MLQTVPEHPPAPRRRRARLGWMLPLLVLPVIAVFVLASLVNPAAEAPTAVPPILKGSHAPGLPEAEPLLIPGTPLSILLSQDASFQVRRSEAFGSDPQANGMVYSNLSDLADSGLFVSYAGVTLGPGFDNRSITALDGRYQAWSPLSLPVLSGSGAAGNPYLASASVQQSSGVNLSLQVQYTNGREYFLLSWTICPPAGGAVFLAYLAADVQLTSTLPELSQGRYDALTGAVSAYNPSSGWSEHLKPLTPADRYWVSNDVIVTPTLSRPLWDAIQIGTNLANSVPLPTDLGDNSLALQWAQPTNQCRSLLVEWHVVQGPQIPLLLNRKFYLPLIRK